ncbi:MAG: PTS sugar transporter subunit IIC [Erysipelotrichaceae bacterium]|jgi:PTS system cellobiose-specific IIC component
MKNLGVWFEEKFLPALNKVGSSKYLSAARDGIVAIIPFMMIGSFALLITSLPFPKWETFIAPIAPVINIIYTACTGFISIIAVVSTAIQFAKYFEVNQLSTGFIALISFVVTQTTPEGIRTDNFGTGGLFLAILIAIVSEKIVEIFTKKNWQIKLPESVPTMVYESFAALIPGIVSILLFWFVTHVLGIDLNSLVATLCLPLVKGLDTWFGTMVIVLISTLLWCCGINEAVLEGVIYPIWFSLLAENTALFEAGKAATHLGGYGWQYFGFWMGGTGGTMGLLILMLLSKAKEYKSLGQLSLAPAIFQINEPITFGFPICFNPIMCIPYILVPMVTTTIYFGAISAGLCNAACVSIPWTTPLFINGFLVTGGDWRAIVVQLINLIVSVVIYYPFFKYSEKQALAREAGKAE